MALNIKTPNISPKEALSNIWARVTKAVEDGKKKAGVTAKTEAVMEAASDADDDEYGDVDLFGDDTTETAKTDTAPVESTKPDSEYGDEDLFGEPEPATPAQDPKVIKGVLGTDGKLNKETSGEPSASTWKKARTPSKDEKELNAKRLREYEQQVNAQWSYSVAEMSKELKQLFTFAAENSKYLEDAGELITEDEFRSIFFAEYQNYAKRGELKSNARALAAVPDILERKMPWLLAQFNERLHGRGNFLENGSLMHYLLRLGNKETVRVPEIRTGEKLNVGGEEGLCNFIISRDLTKCEAWVGSRIGGHDVPSSTKRGLALDILINGLNKPELLKQVGGVGSKMYRIPRYGSLERRGDDVCVVGTKTFLDEFYVRFSEFLKQSEVENDTVPNYGPATDKKGKEIGRGLLSLSYPEKPYLDLINDAVDAGLFIPIAFNSGTTSLDSGSATTGDGTRRADVLQTHQRNDAVESNDYSVGEQVSVNNLLDVMEKPGFVQLAERYGLGDLRKELLALGDKANSAKLSKLTSALLKMIADNVGIPSQIDEKQSIYAIKLGTERSIARLAAEKEGLTPSECSALLAVVAFNNVIIDRVSKIVAGHDVADIAKMNAGELRTNAMPSIYFGKLAELAMTGNYPDEDVLNYAKGYLINALGSSVGFTTTSGQIFSNAADFCKTMGVPMVTGEVIKREIAQLDTDSLPLYAQKFEEKAEGSLGGDEDSDVQFYDENKSTTLDRLASSNIARAISAVVKDASGVAVIMHAVEIVSGFEEGFLSKYLEAIKGGDNAAVAEMAAEIKKVGGGVVTISLTNSSAETIKRTNNAEKAKATKDMRREIRRNRWK